MVGFEWDKEKARSNLFKHGISFDEAKTVFDDSFYVDFYDPAHSKEENRYIIVGESVTGKILLVSYTERENNIRIISCRKATKQEKITYEG